MRLTAYLFSLKINKNSEVRWSSYRFAYPAQFKNVQGKILILALSAGSDYKCLKFLT